MTYIISVSLSIKQIDLANGKIYLNLAEPVIEYTNQMVKVDFFTNELYRLFLNSLLGLISLQTISFEPVALPDNITVQPLTFSHGQGFVALATDFTIDSRRILV